MTRAQWSAALRRPTTLAALAVLLALAIVWGVLLARAAQPPSLDQRAHDVASQLQCPVCNGESVADSPSGLASEMRGVIRGKLAQGESEQQVIQYFEARYGSGILESPPKQGFTLMIWLPPVALLLVGGYIVFALGREWSAARPALAALAGGAGVATARSDDAGEDAADGLTEEERRRLRATLLRELEQDEGFAFDETPMRTPTRKERV